MTNTNKFEVKKFSDAIERLAAAIKEPQTNNLAIDGSIQRFEFTYEQCWKTLKKCLAQDGLDAGTPREVFQKAYQAGWLADEDLWLRMIKDRNETSHTYNETKAKAIYQNIPSYLKGFKDCLKVLQKKITQ